MRRKESIKNGGESGREKKDGGRKKVMTRKRGRKERVREGRRKTEKGACNGVISRGFR